MLNVMLKNGKAYVSGPTHSEYRIDGQPAVRCNGSSQWLVCDHVPQKITRLSYGTGEIVCWKKSDDAPTALPDTLAPCDVEWDSEECEYRCLTGYDISNYEAQRGPSIVAETEVPFQIIDRDCEPVQMARWASVDWPANIEHYPEIQHKYPCRISRNDLFYLVHDAVEEIVKRTKDLSMDSYRNIGTFNVNKSVSIPASLQRPVKEEYYKTFHSKKKSTRIVTKTSKSIKLFTYDGFYDKHSGDDTILGRSISAKNYEELTRLVQEHIDWVCDMAATEAWTVCEHCKGHGITRKDV